jgi:hypothetical protein
MVLVEQRIAMQQKPELRQQMPMEPQQMSVQWRSLAE